MQLQTALMFMSLNHEHARTLLTMFPLCHMKSSFSLPELASLNKQFWQAWPCHPFLEAIYSLYGNESGSTLIILLIYFPGYIDVLNAPLRCWLFHLLVRECASMSHVKYVLFRKLCCIMSWVWKKHRVTEFPNCRWRSADLIHFQNQNVKKINKTKQKTVLVPALLIAVGCLVRCQASAEKPPTISIHNY